MKLIDRILAGAAAHPGRTALAMDTESLSYGQLAALAQNMARYLDRRLGEDRSPVGVLCDGAAELPALFLACLLTGRPFLPVDALAPALRREEILRDSGAQITLSARELPAMLEQGRGDADFSSPQSIGRVPPAGATPPQGREAEALATRNPCDASASRGIPATSLSVTMAQGREGKTPASPSPCDASASRGYPAPAYILYTSGSTGRPKGVAIGRDNLDYFLEATRDLPPETPGEAVWLTHAPWTFDLSVLPLWQGLGRGDRVVCLDTSRGLDFPALGSRMGESGATCWVSTPSFARLWLKDPGFGEGLLPRLSLFFFCGEVLDPGTVRSLLERFTRARVINAYGPTEATVAAALTPISREMLEGDTPLPVGRALEGTRLLIAGEDGGPLPDGGEGEILIGGPGVGEGYHGLPDLTRERFFCRDGVRWYRTGDYGFLREGMLYFAGRRDLQVKCGGCRVELQEVEAHLLALPGVGAALAAAPGGRLMAMVSPKPGARLLPWEVKRALGERLPRYLIPRRILVAAEIPLTPQGKLDRSGAEPYFTPGIKSRQVEGKP